MNRLPYRVLLGAALFAVACAPAAAAGLVKVAFVEPSRFTDAGTVEWEESTNLQRLGEHLQSLGERYLRTGEELKIEVLDVDLAGWTRPSRATGAEVRLIRGGADWPRISLRYSLELDGKVVRSGSEVVADMNYSRGLSDPRASGALRYEKTMLERWFRTTFVDQRAAAN